VFGAASDNFYGVSLFIIKKIHAVIYGYKLTESITARDVNGAPKPDYPWGIPPLGLGYGLKQIPMGIDLE
jgi:hypothetical protein